MKDTLKAGDAVRIEYKVPANKTVPHLYPEFHDFQLMPTVFATGFMVGLMEWACMRVLEPHLDPGEGSLGVHIDVSHGAATVPGQIVTVDATCTRVAGRRVAFHVVAHDGLDKIGEGSHERAVVPWERFVARVNEKAKRARVGEIAGVRRS
ncbi:MAG: thioesterase family protein [Deltaproteobacteria bacterium]